MPPRKPQSEVTRLSVKDELRFQAWAHRNGITDVDHPDSHYDYRGYWRSVKGADHEQGAHFPDTFKQHGHPTFSVESKYSRGPNDGGHWQGENFIPQVGPATADRRVPNDILPQMRPNIPEQGNFVPNVMRAQGARIPQAPATPVRDAFINTPPAVLRALAEAPFGAARELSRARNPDEALHALTGVGLSMDPNSPAARPSDARGGRLQQAIALGLLAAPSALSAGRMLPEEVAAASHSILPQDWAALSQQARLRGGRATPVGNLNLEVPAFQRPTYRAPVSAPNTSLDVPAFMRRGQPTPHTLGNIRSRFRTLIGGGEPLPKVSAVNEPAASQMAHTYETLKSEPNNPQVRSAYEAFNRETQAQAEALRNAGYSWDFVDHDPYPPTKGGSKAMLRDLRENHHISVYKTAGEQSHPLMTNDQNNLFRAVHEILGHGVDEVPFSAKGEENAFRSHAQMYSPEARRVMATETRGQNSWFNYGPHRGVPAPDRPFAPQKAALWPTEQLGGYESFPTERIAAPSVKGVNGQYYTGANHDLASEAAADAMRATPEGRALMEQNRGSATVRGSEGFQTTTGRQITREEARNVAGATGQAPTLSKQYTQLHSSDISNPHNFAGEHPIPQDLIAAAAQPRVFTADRLGLPRAEITSLGHSLAHHLGNAADFPGWLASVGQQNPLLGEMLAAAPEAAGRIHNAALGQLPFVQHLQPFSDIMRLYEKGGAGWEGWYGPYYRQLLDAGVPPDVANRVLRSSSILSTQKAPTKEVLTALRAWQANELGQPITTQTTQHTGAITDIARGLIEGQPWADPAAFKFGERQKTSNYVLSELLGGRADSPTLDTWHARAYLGPNIEHYLQGTPPGLKMTPAQWAVMQSRTIADALRANAPTGDFQARVWGGITGYDPAYGGVGMHRGHLLGEHLASGQFDPLMQRYPGLYHMADEVVPPVGPFEELPY